jgi:phage tail-like protein
MPVDKDTIKNTYPLPAYNYRVTLMDNDDATVVGFAEVSGLSLEYEPVTYKHGLSFITGSRIIRGMRQPIRLTLRKGIVQSGDYLYRWIADTYGNAGLEGVKRDIVIDLCDEAGEPVVRWHVRGALPIKLDAPGFDASTNDVAIEAMELVAHDLSIIYNP